MEYIIKKASQTPDIKAEFSSASWNNANIAEIKNFRKESSEHRPDVKLKVLYTDKALYGLFNVKDQYVICTHNSFQASVCKDSCVEFFIKPGQEKGYFNFEFNCGGNFLCYYVTDPTRTPNGLGEYKILTEDDKKHVQIFHTMPEVVNPEITTPTEWRLGFAVDLELFSKYKNVPSVKSGTEWSANFYKCADKSSHPHWISWAPVSALNFHLPECFGNIKFE